MTSGYLCVLLVAVVVDGAQLSSDPTPTLVRGRVVAPAALVAQFADRVTLGNGDAVVVERNGRTCAVRTQRDDPFGRVQIAPLARCLGATVSWDGSARTLSIAFVRANVVRTPAPFDPTAPQVAPSAVFTPEPRPPTPRPIDTGVPRPRRTAIPASPSWPSATTRPRRSAL